MDILKIENLSKIYGEGETQVKALDNVSFSVPKGQFVAIIGPSGSGKSTLLHILGGVDRPTSGKVYLDGQDVYAQNTSRITTGALNSVLADATARVQPPSDKGRRLKIYYMTQAGTKPPHFVIFCNDARLFHFSYQRYLENQIREVFGLQGTPVRITIRQKGDKEE